MLGVCLLFVGIVLINNGMCTLYNVDGKSTAVMNIFTGGLSLFINFVNLVQGNYYAAGTGLLFCFTYLFVAFSKILKLSPIPFAWFSTFVAESITDVDVRNTGDCNDSTDGSTFNLDLVQTIKLIQLADLYTLTFVRVMMVQKHQVMIIFPPHFSS